MNRAGAGIEVFVYGTLLRGERYHHLLAAARFAGAARTVTGYALYDLGAYPAMVRGGGGAVAGELYAVDRPTLAALDELEEHPDYYRREYIELDTGRRAQSYLLAAQDVRGRLRIASGDWRARHIRRQL